MKMIMIEIKQDGDLWRAEITNNNGLKVHIDGCETADIARHQARMRKRELKKAGLL